MEFWNSRLDFIEEKEVNLNFTKLSQILSFIILAIFIVEFFIPGLLFVLFLLLTIIPINILLMNRNN